MNENENNRPNAASDNISLEDLRNSYLQNDDSENAAGAQEDESGSVGSDYASAGNSEDAPQGDIGGMPNGQTVPNGYDARFGSAMGVSAQNDRLSELTAENEALKRQLAAASEAAVANAADANGKVAEVLSGEDLPTFDDEEYSFASDSERREMMGNYTKALIDYAVRKAQTDVLNRVAPLIDEYDKTVENAAFDNALQDLGSSPEFSDITSYKDDIRRLCERDEFKGMKPYQRVALSALVAKGMRASPAAQSESDIGSQADAILRNDALMKELEMRKARKLDSARGNFPVQSASGGLSSAAYVPPRKAQSIEELRDLYSE